MGHEVLNHRVEWQRRHTGERHNYMATNGHGDIFSLSCDPHSRRDGWVINVSIGQDPVPANSPISFRIGKSRITMHASEDGQIHLASALDADPYYWLWTMIHQGQAMNVSLDDMRRAEFNLTGAPQALADGGCSPRRSH
ncbi:hypothetical protein [Breoghania sp. L-A4]|uniref:hypothetical protein n=1 Tax=Breoghania sp. L-A4 TaxID=2304600 RepID=UPI0013C2A6CC|nr:hypothetical protein [Breoghania sp. L-A4]